MASAAILIPQHQRSRSRSSSPSSPPTGRLGLQFESTQQQHRQSLLSPTSAVSSSGASYRTAPLTPTSRSSLALSVSSQSSTNTVNVAHRERESESPSHPPPMINPHYVHSIAKTQERQEIHIVRVTEDTVEIESGSPPRPFYDRVGKPVLQAIRPDSSYAHAGPPPPSPPASVEHRAEDDNADYPFGSEVSPSSSSFEPPPPAPALRQVQSDYPASYSHYRTPSDSDMVSERLRSPSASTASTTATHTRPGLTSTQHSPLQRSSTDTKTSHTAVRAVVTAPTPPISPQHPAFVAEASSSKPNSHLSIDGYLQPPSISQARPTRRNTTGSTPLTPRHRPHGKGASQPHDDAALADGGVSLELESDIEIQAERIRRERMSKRAKAQQEAEAAMTRAGEQGGADGHAQDTPLVGNLIGEDHVNYVLMYNMLTGIRIGVRHSISVRGDCWYAHLFLTLFSGVAVSGQGQATAAGRRFRRAA